MGREGVWYQLGYAGNPYSVLDLRGDEEGSALLVGRERELKAIRMALLSSGGIPTVEGPIGSGKTSLLNVFAHRIHCESVSERAGRLYLPSAQRFQMVGDARTFESSVYMSVAQTLIQHSAAFKLVGLPRPKVKELQKWLNSPINHSGGLSVSWPGAGAGVSLGSTVNDASGFERSGFPRAVQFELQRCFPSDGGGIICVLDNVELAESPASARRLIEAVRDTCFRVPQLRWIICGSRGMVSRLRTERMSGILQAPTLVQPLPREFAGHAVAKRLERLSLNEESVPPVSPQEFLTLYDALHQNLRDAMSYAERYSRQILQGRPLEVHHVNRSEAFLQWLRGQANQVVTAATSVVHNEDWRAFHLVCTQGGRVVQDELLGHLRSQWHLGKASPSKNTANALSRRLVTANLVSQEVHPERGKRTIYAVTPDGWLANWYLVSTDVGHTYGLSASMLLDGESGARPLGRLEDRKEDELQSLRASRREIESNLEYLRMSMPVVQDRLARGTGSGEIRDVQEALEEAADIRKQIRRLEAELAAVERREQTYRGQ